MLDQVEIFHGLSDEELKALEGSSTTRAFPKNTVVIHENDPADSLFVIESGKVKVCLLYTSPSPRDTAISRMPSSA